MFEMTKRQSEQGGVFGHSDEVLGIARICEIEVY